MVVIFGGESRMKLSEAVIFDGESRVTNYNIVEFAGESRHSCSCNVIFDGESRHRIIPKDTMYRIMQPLNIAASTDGMVSATSNHSIKIGTKLVLYEGANSYDLTKYLNSINLSRRKNDMSTWSFKLVDNTDKDLSPGNASSLLYGKLNIDFYKDKYKLGKYLVLTVEQGDMAWNSSKLIITDSCYSSKDRMLSISGCDRCKHLYSMGENMDPWENTTAKVIVGDILRNFGVDNYRFEFKDYDVKEFAFVNATAMDRIKDLLFVGMATWYYEGDIFYAFNDVDSVTADWIYKDRYNIYNLDAIQTLNQYYNEINIGRTTPADNVCYYQGKEYGFHRENLCTPLIDPKYQELHCYSGRIRCLYAGKEDGVICLIAADGGLPCGFLPPGCFEGFVGAAEWISWWYLQDNDMSGSVLDNAVVGYKFRILGINPDSLVNGKYDEDYNYHLVREEEQKKYGVHKYPSIIENSLIPNSEWAEDLAVWILRQHGRTKDMINKVSSLNLWLYPCQTISVEDYGSSFTKKGYYTDEVTVSISLDEANCTVLCSKYDDS